MSDSQKENIEIIEDVDSSNLSSEKMEAKTEEIPKKIDGRSRSSANNLKLARQRKKEAMERRQKELESLFGAGSDSEETEDSDSDDIFRELVSRRKPKTSNNKQKREILEMKLMLAKLAKSHRKLKKQNKQLKEKPLPQPVEVKEEPKPQLQQPTINYNILPPIQSVEQPKLQQVELKPEQKIANYKRSGLMNSLRNSIIDDKKNLNK